MSEIARLPVRHAVDLKAFHEEILPAGVPVVLEDLVQDWPSVRAARSSPRALVDLIRGFDRGQPISVLEGPPSIRGRLFYREDMTGLNFTRTRAGIGETLERLLVQGGASDPPAVFIEALPTDVFLPDFAATHPMPFVSEGSQPRLWMGNTVTVQTHFDLFDNLACVVGGRRRFTLFPPAQVSNLYMGPVDFTPSGTPISMVPLHDPDLARFPRFAEALRHAMQADLTPGDALYIPYGWWHHVQSLEPFNVLVNYWWNTATKLGSPYGALLHATLVLRDLPAAQRAVWRAMFESFVFNDPEEALRHLPPEQRGLLGPPSAQRANAVRDVIARMMAHDSPRRG
jgi:Cupin-like domain